jgi:single-strand DNA-binding protein
MSRSLNRAQIIGNLGTDPELKALASGMAVCRLSVATSESWNDKTTGEARKETEWHRITLWGKQAEIASHYLHKGDKVFVEGKIKTRKWQYQSGQARYSTETTADNLLMLGGRFTDTAAGAYASPPAYSPPGYPATGAYTQAPGHNPPPPRSAPQRPAPVPQRQGGYQPPPPPETLDFDDDIPF